MDMQEKDLWREESGKLRTRRVGSVTFGMTLILFGVLFLLHMVVPTLHYELIFQFWPVVFVEILVENHRSNAEKCRFVYDFPAILMLVVMLLFAMVMAAAEFSLHYYQRGWW